jgi:hypothetical protein
MGEYTVVPFRGHLMDNRSRAIFLDVEQELYGKPVMDLIQGCYNPGGVGASAGTHDRGGAWDCSYNDAAKKSRAFRDRGCPSWPRPTLRDSSGNLIWNEHDHSIDAFNKRLQSPVATGQVDKYNAGQDGLAGTNPDNMHYHPELKPFDYDAWVRKQNRIRRLRMRLMDSIRDSRAHSAIRRNKIEKLRRRQAAAAKRRERLRRRLRRLGPLPKAPTDI